jgi:hypothetical protein
MTNQFVETNQFPSVDSGLTTETEERHATVAYALQVLLPRRWRLLSEALRHYAHRAHTWRADEGEDAHGGWGWGRGRDGLDWIGIQGKECAKLICLETYETRVWTYFVPS